jgi:uncharacterized protein
MTRPSRFMVNMGIRQILISTLNKSLQYGLIFLIAGIILALIFGYQALVNSPQMSGLIDRLATFATIFLGIFIEAAPFLLLGTLASGLVETFVRQDELQHLAPRNPLGAALFGSFLGLFFPVCECGVVPLTRRLFGKGLPQAAGISFLLASPVINPIVIASTLAAFGVGSVLFLRVGLTLVIAILTGLYFAVTKDPAKLLNPIKLPPTLTLPNQLTQTPSSTLRVRLRKVSRIAVDEFFEMGRYLVLGALLAALMQTFIPQTALFSLGQGPVTSVLAMMLLAALLSICSTVDAFIALSFVSFTSPGAILAFLVFGPMVDIKSTLMYFRVFQRKTAFSLILLPFLFSLLAGILINLLLS